MANTTFSAGTIITSDWLNEVDGLLYPPATNTTSTVGNLVFELTSNTSLTIKVMGSDSVLRSVVLTLA